MIFEIFQNGSDKVNRRLLLLEYACDAYVLSCGIISASLAVAYDTAWAKMIPHYQLWFGLIGFFLGLSVAVTKGTQMFFNKAAQLYRQTLEDAHTAQPKNVIEIPKQ